MDRADSQSTTHGTVPLVADGRWETCEVIREEVKGGFLSATVRFVADAVGPTGRYQAGTSPAFKLDGNASLEDPGARGGVRGADPALGALVSALVRGGWEPLETRGQYWSSHRLRRRAPPAARGGTASVAAAGGKSLGVAYAFWLVLGLLGGHRYYLARTGTGLLQTLTLGGLGVWWLVDLVFLPGMVRRANGAG